MQSCNTCPLRCCGSIRAGPRFGTRLSLERQAEEMVMRKILAAVLAVLLLSMAAGACSPANNGEYDHRYGGRD